jgi:2'-5' RNA ligase
MSLRLFVALDLPPELRQRLAMMAGGVPGAKWVAPERMHLTLRFIGEADGTLLTDVCRALAEVEGAPFELRLEGVGRFGVRKRVNQLWAGVAPNEDLQRLQRRLEGALTALGLEPEGRRYHPHVTLARLKAAPAQRVAGFLAEHSLFESESFAVEDFVLYSSLLAQSGAIYRAEAEFPL